MHALSQNFENIQPPTMDRYFLAQNEITPSDFSRDF